MDIFNNLWQIAFGERSIVTQPHQDNTEPGEIEKISLTEEPQKLQLSTYHLLAHEDPEIRALQLDLGRNLEKGMTLEYSLHDLLDLIPRQRMKSDAYKGLIRKLQEQYGVELIINSKK